MPKLQDEANKSYRKLFAYFAGASQIILVLLYGTLTEYGPAPGTAGYDNSEVNSMYPFYQDVHVMIFIGFGFLMTFLKKYGFSSVGYNFLISCLAIQWGMICNGIFHVVATAGTSDYHGFTTIKLGIVDLIRGDFAAAAVLISFGAVLGKTTPLQMLLVVFFELIFYAINEAIGAGRLQAVDMGGSIFVHTFGAYFGLAMSWVISRSKFNKGSKSIDDHPKNDSDKTSDMFAMIGTIFLWMFWPSFNGALASEDQQYRVVINTVLALCASCAASFLIITLLNDENKFDMVSIQNATLAGGVAVGSSSDLVIQPWGALMIGLVAGLVSVVGYEKITPWLSRVTGLDDTCGVHNLHGMPGVLGALAGAISASMAGETAYGAQIGSVFPARASSNATAAALMGFSAGSDRTAQQQGAIQIAAVCITIGIAIIGGMFTGMIIKMPCFLPGLPEEKANWCTCGQSSNRDTWYEDKEQWTVEEDDEESSETDRLFETSALAKTIDLEIAMLTQQRNELLNVTTSDSVAVGMDATTTDTGAKEVEMTEDK